MDTNQNWQDWPRNDSEPEREYHPPVTQSVEERKEPTVQEDVGAMQALLNRVVNRAIESTDLAHRVAALQEDVHKLQEQVSSLQSQLFQEQNAHRETQTALAQVQDQLNHRENTIKDLVQERDIVVRERDEARQDRDKAKQEIAQWVQSHDEVFNKLTAKEQEAQRLQEQLDAALAKIEGIKQAFTVLHAA